jgi:hypothetical protein
MLMEQAETKTASYMRCAGFSCHVALRCVARAREITAGTSIGREHKGKPVKSLVLA